MPANSAKNVSHNDAEKSRQFSNQNRHLICTTAEPTTCAKCRMAVWVAMVNGFKVQVDATPLDPTTEIMLRLEGVRIYQTCAVVGSRFQLQLRNAWHITKGDAKAVALASHDCSRGVAEIVELFPGFKSKEAEF